MQGVIRAVVGAQAAVAVAAAVYLSRGDGEKKMPPAGAPSTEQTVDVERVLRAAAAIVKASRSYGFVCSTPRGQAAPDCRIMDLHQLKPNESLDFGLVSRSFTRKAEALRQQGACTIAFHDPRASGEAGYLVLSGEARELTAPEERRERWKSSWSFFHPGPQAEEVVQWVFSPRRLEMVSNLEGITDDWAAVTALREPGAPWVLQPRRSRAERVPKS